MISAILETFTDEGTSSLSGKPGLGTMKKLNLELLRHQIPGNLMVQCPQRVGMVFPSIPRYTLYIQSSKSLSDKEKEHLWKVFNKEESEKLCLELSVFISRQDEHEVFSFFQRVRKNENEDFQWFFNIAKLLKKDYGFSEEIVVITHPVEGMGTMAAKISRVLDEHDYIRQNLSKFSALTKREKEIITLMSQGKTTAKISEILFISENTVITHRKNICNKLGTNCFAKQLKFALAFDLV